VGRGEAAAWRPILSGPAARVRQGQHLGQDAEEDRHVHREARLRPRDCGHRLLRRQVALPLGAGHREIRQGLQVSIHFYIHS
jgi:hypothetical protein